MKLTPQEEAWEKELDLFRYAATPGPLKPWDRLEGWERVYWANTYLGCARYFHNHPPMSRPKDWFDHYEGSTP